MKNEPVRNGYYKAKYTMNENWVVILFRDGWVFGMGSENGCPLWVANKHIEKWGARIKMPDDKRSNQPVKTPNDIFELIA